VGDTVELKPVGKGKVLISKVRKSEDKNSPLNENLLKLLDVEPKRTGKPENPAPDEMKSIWNG
jgi:hypothetical protein